MPSSTLRDQLDADGFVVIRNILTLEQVLSLRVAAERTTALARSGGWPHVRTVGKQFPPWDAAEAAEKGIWGVQGLNDPALPDHAAFLRVYFGDEVLGPAAELMACSADDDLVMELHNLLVRPDRDFALRWHRDDIPAEATPEEESARLDELHREGYWHAQWNLALCDGDESLVVVPGSHRRARTAAERAADPFEPSMPGQLVVRLGAGDTVFYDNNILHRGGYDAGRERLTLHGSAGRAGPGAGRLRARNVLQHGVGAYVGRCDFSVLDERYRARAEAMRARLVQLGRESGDVGYSLTG
ncbi:hypothetical protein DL764_008446 [Monosporascus ibericus]|uniref:Phytanoyl-CoA dioxygenase n=1 Tax=Monosporascus ibericus TaxID=155417 RepID=A0A4Q4SXI4_9PEZI|nr:hypothetical protein DL764_008446 [Monosporascus ibericus]